MKTLFVLLVSLTCMNFFLINVDKEISDWGDWKIVNPKFNGIEARAKRGDFNQYALKYHWEFQFRNRYLKDVKFRYGIGPRSEACYLNYIKHVQSNGDSDVGAYLINENNTISICIDNVDFE